MLSTVVLSMLETNVAVNAFRSSTIIHELLCHKKSEVDLDDHLASSPSYDDLVSSRRPVAHGRMSNAQQRAGECGEPFLRL